MNYNCEICNISFTTKQRLNTHSETEKHKTVLKLYNNWNLKYKNEINMLNLKLNEEIKNKQELSLTNIKLNDKINILEEKIKEYRTIVEKAATKSTTVKNYTHNNYLNYISTEPLKLSELKSQLKEIVNCETVMYDDNDFHDHIVDNILRDKSGKDKVLCTDINRKNFTYKDEKSGQMIFDPELERLREKLKKGTNIKQIRKDLLEKLVTEYEENGCIGIDPYKQFSEIINKLNFGTPFVDHVAKKTYVKTKNGKEILNNEQYSNDINSLEDNSNDELQYDGLTQEEYKEYKELLKEFGNL
jgi:hypothetical protein